MGRFTLRRATMRRTGNIVVGVRFEGKEAEELRNLAQGEGIEQGTLVKRMVRHCLADLAEHGDREYF